MSRSATTQRKRDHIKICLNEDVSFKTKTNGFENYEFIHYALTEVNLDTIDLSTKFFSKKISYPFIISCMTGGTVEAEKINEKLAIVASELNIPIGLGSQRQALESNKFHSTYKVVRNSAGNVPVLGNIGAAQVANSNKIVDEINYLIDLINADVMVIHTNPLQELIQKNGDKNFTNLLKIIEKICLKIPTPIIVKEVGAGISKTAAKKLLDIGVKGIDVAGAGGTNWTSVELIRNDEQNIFFSEWGIPTSYCIRKCAELKKKYSFVLISSGGIKNGIDIAKSLALGADLCASARPILQSVVNSDIKGVIKLIKLWFDDVKKIMYLTGSQSCSQLKKQKLIRKSEFY